MKHGAFRLGCDIGGTFTDFVLVNDETGAFTIYKCLTTPADPSQAARRELPDTQPDATSPPRGDLPQPQDAGTGPPSPAATSDVAGTIPTHAPRPDDRLPSSKADGQLVGVSRRYDDLDCRQIQSRHGIRIIFSGGVQQRFTVGAGFKASCQHIGILAYQDDIGIAAALNLIDYCLKLGRISGIGFDGYQVGTKSEPDSLIFKVFKFLKSGIDLGVSHGVTDEEGNTGRVLKSLLMAEHNGLAANLERPITNTDGSR